MVIDEEQVQALICKTAARISSDAEALQAQGGLAWALRPSHGLRTMELVAAMMDSLAASMRAEAARLADAGG